MKVTKEDINKRVLINLGSRDELPDSGICEVHIIELSPSGEYFRCMSSHEEDWRIWLESEGYPILEFLPQREWKLG